MIWLLAGYMWLFIHRPFEVWPWLGEYHIERVYMLVTILAWACTGRKTWTSNRMNVAIALFCSILLLTWIISPYRESNSKELDEVFKASVFYLLVVSSVRNGRDLKILIGAFLTCTALYMAHSYREYLNGRHFYRMDTVRMIGVDSYYNDPNSFAASLLYALPLCLPFWRAANRWPQWSLLLCYVGLTFTCILLTGSRTGIVGMVVLAGFAVSTLRYRWVVAAAVVLLLPVIWGALPQDRQDRYLTIFDPTRGPANAKESADSRIVLFKIAYELWQKQPLFGYGPGSFPAASGTGFYVHTLYGQLLAEVGLVGTLGFLLVLYGFVMNGRQIAAACRSWQPTPFIKSLNTGILITIVMLLLMGLGGHNLFRYTWLWYGAFQVAAVRVARDEYQQPLELEFDEPTLDEIALDSEWMHELALNGN